MTDNTIDSEVDEILASIKGKSWEEWSNIGVDKEGHLIPKKGDNYSEWGELHNAITNLIAQEANKARLDELELAVQQFIFNTKRNPDNFSEYATHRIKALTADKEQADA